MRERTTWSRDSIKQAAVAKKADPYLMNQDHVNKQPAADAYVTGDPSTFAEDVHPSAGTWEAEYAGGQVKRNEIGQPEMRKDTFNHPEKTAADKALLLKKANIAIRVASMMLGKNASETAVEDQSVSLMHMPDAELVDTFNRLAGDEPVQSVEQQQAAQQQQAQMTQQSAYQAAQDQAKAAIQAGDEAGCKQAIEAMVQAQMQQQAFTNAQQAPTQAPAQQSVEAMVTAAVKKALQDQTQAPVAQTQQQAVQQQAVQQQQAVEQQQAVQQQQAQQAPAQQAPVAQQPPAQQQAVQQPEVMADDAMLDEMLMDQSGVSEMDIEMDAPSMDTGDAGLGPEDEVLKTLFASDETEQAQQAQQGQTQQEQAAQGQAKSAMTRTASTRTVGTRPSGGVSRVGGGAPAGRGSDADKLSSLWASAPDVKDAFNM